MVDILRLNSEINDWTSHFGIENFAGPNRTQRDKNAFAHAYASAHIAFENGWAISNVLGTGREYRSFVTDTYKALTGEKGYSVEGVWRDGHRDMFNNQVGNAIADYVERNGLPKASIGYLVADALKNGQLISSEFTDARVSSIWFARPVYSGPSVLAKGQIQRHFGVLLQDHGFPVSTPNVVSSTETRLRHAAGYGDTQSGSSKPSGSQGNGLGPSSPSDPRGPWQMPGSPSGNSTGASPSKPSTTPAPASSTGASSAPSVKTVAADPGGFGLGPGSRDGGNSMGSSGSAARPAASTVTKSVGSSSSLSGGSASQSSGRSDRDQQGGSAVTKTTSATQTKATSGAGSTTRTVSTPAGPQQVNTASRYEPTRTVSTPAGPKQVSSSSSKSSPSTSSSSKSSSSSSSSRSGSSSSSGGSRRRPVLLDLDGNGVRVNELRDSTAYADIGNDGFKRRSAWAGAGDGVLFVDADGDGKLSGRREVVFTDWDPSADTDMQALRQVFDTNGNGLLDAGDAQWSGFRVMVTNADGTTTTRTLAELGIQSINLTTDETHYAFKDGSTIEGETIFTRTDGTTGKAVSMALAGEAAGYVVTETRTVDAAGAVTVFLDVRGADGALVRTMSRVTSADDQCCLIAA